MRGGPDAVGHGGVPIVNRIRPTKGVERRLSDVAIGEDGYLTTVVTKR